MTRETGSAIVGSPDEFKPLIVSGDHLYLQKMFYLENRFVDDFAPPARGRIGVDRREHRAVRCATCSIARVAQRKAAELDERTASAVRAAMRHPMTIISGGPGTGKTTIVLSILRTLRRLGVTCEEIALAAPTGKAANRHG